MERRDRTNSERPGARAICPTPTLLAVLLLVTVVPGAAAYAVLERDVSLRTTLRDAPRDEESREDSVRGVSRGLAVAITRTVAAQGAAVSGVGAGVDPIEVCVASDVLSEVAPALIIAGQVRLALLNLPPPLV